MSVSKKKKKLMTWHNRPCLVTKTSEKSPREMPRRNMSRRLPRPTRSLLVPTGATFSNKKKMKWLKKKKNSKIIGLGPNVCHRQKLADDVALLCKANVATSFSFYLKVIFFHLFRILCLFDFLKKVFCR